MSNFDDNVKHLDIVPSTEAPDGLSSRRINHRPPAIYQRVRDIKKLRYNFVIPAITFTPSGLRTGCLRRQLNYTLPRAFTISTLDRHILPGFTNLFHPVVTLRSITAGRVSRYLLPLGTELQWQSKKLLSYIAVGNAPIYNGEVIGPNFVVEFWDFNPAATSAQQTFIYSTSILFNPATADDTDITVGPSLDLDRAALAIAFPEALPTPYTANMIWSN